VTTATQPVTDRRYLNRKQRDLNTLRGIPNRVDATEARNHLTELHRTMGWLDIAAASGSSACHLRYIANGRTLIINRVTHDRILAVRAATAPTAGLYVDATGARRRIHALMARGHSQDAIAAAAHTTQHRISVISLGHPRVRQKIADRIADAYDHLAHTDGTSKRALYLARKNQWLTTDYWADVDRIDDPDFDPNAEIPRGQQIADDVRWLMTVGGLTKQQAADRLGRSHSYINAALSDFPARDNEVAA